MAKLRVCRLALRKNSLPSQARFIHGQALNRSARALRRLHRAGACADTCRPFAQNRATLPRTRRPFPFLFGLSLFAAVPAFAQSTLPTEREFDKHATQTYNGSSCAQITDTLPPIEAAPDDKVRISADNADLVRNGLSTLSGSVTLKRDDQEINAASLNYATLRHRVIHHP